MELIQQKFGIIKTILIKINSWKFSLYF